MRKILGATLGLVLVAGIAGAQITGSAHDFSGQGWGTIEICQPCHTPHNASIALPVVLWNHEVTAATYTLYTSPTMNATTGQPDGVSRACLSCHDGTVALDSFGGATGTNFIGGDANFGTDLSNDHPVSFAYAQRGQSAILASQNQRGECPLPDLSRKVAAQVMRAPLMHRVADRETFHVSLFF
jgi:hypothetical protein